MRANRGFTLMEMMVTLAIASILLALAVPNMRDFVQNNRAVSLSSNFMSAMNVARSEAIKRGSPVSVCASGDVNQTSCGGPWTNGWIVFDDPNGDGDLAVASDRVKVYGMLNGGATLTSAVNAVTFSNTGFVDAGSGNFTLSAADCRGNYGRVVALSNTGRMHVSAIACP